MKLTKIEIILAIASIATLIMLGIIIIFSVGRSSNQNTLPSPTPTITQIQTQYNNNPQEKLINNIINKDSVHDKDLQTKETIINNLFLGKTGTAYTSSDVSISYLKSVDIFQGEILTTNIDSAKQEVVNWFVGQGVSKQAICKLPLMFFLRPAVLEQLRNTNVVFSPLPPGC